MNMIVGVSLVKDEADVIGPVVRHTAGYVDRLLIADNGSTDGTRDILRDLADEIDHLQVVDDLEIGYYQSRKVSALAAAAAEGQRCYVVPFDADEFWLGLDRLRDLTAGPLAAWVPGFDYLPAPHFGPVPDPLRSMTRRSTSSASFRPKVAPLAHPDLVILQGNHGATLEGRHLPTVEVHGLEIAHFPLRSFDQFRRKARNGGRAYAAAPDLPTGWGAHMRKWGAMNQDELVEEWRRIVTDPPESVEDPLEGRGVTL